MLHDPVDLETIKLADADVIPNRPIGAVRNLLFAHIAIIRNSNGGTTEASPISLRGSQI